MLMGAADKLRLILWMKFHYLMRNATLSVADFGTSKHQLIREFVKFSSFRDVFLLDDDGRLGVTRRFTSDDEMRKKEFWSFARFRACCVNRRKMRRRKEFFFSGMTFRFHFEDECWCDCRISDAQMLKGWLTWKYFKIWVKKSRLNSMWAWI